MRWTALFMLAAIGCINKDSEVADTAVGDSGPDADCDDPSTWYADADGDGWGDASDAVVTCDAPADHVAQSGDCDDGDDAAHPDAEEVCDGGRDNDCDGLADEDDDSLDPESLRTSYPDADGDSYGDDADPQSACEVPDDRVERGGDCDDEDPRANPGADEVCDGAVDEDCDDEVDESGANDAQVWFPDEDGDGYGDDAAGGVSCDPPDDSIDVGGDCDDAVYAINPDAQEICDGVDNDCDDLTDGDDDSVTATWYADADGDGYGTTADTFATCDAPKGYGAEPGDCDDGDDAVHPDALDLCDGVDHDCDGGEDGVVSAAGANHKDVEDAAAAAGAGGAVSVCPGAWPTSLVVDQDLIVTGPYGAELTILEGAGSSVFEVIDGAALQIEGLTLTGGVGSVSDSLPDAGLLGGAVNNLAGAPLIATDCVFRGNTADYGGGVLGNGAAIDEVSSGDHFTRCAFEDNEATEAGGGAYLYGAFLEEVSVSGNVAENAAGLQVLYGALTADGLTIEDNETPDTTGAPALSVAFSEATISDCTIARNGVDGLAAVYVYAATLSLTGCLIEDNFTGAGGGIYAYQSDVSVSVSTIAGHDADDSNGAALYGSGASFALEGTSIEGNESSQGGAVYLYGGDLSLLRGSTIADNAADNYGGGIYATGGAAILVSEGALMRNSAGETGGAVYLSGGSTLESVDGDWGEGADDNAPDDINSSTAGAFTFGDGATFDCDVDGCR